MFKNFSLLTILAGLSLTCLLGVGVSSVSSILFKGAFFFHLMLHLSVLGFAVWILFSLIKFKNPIHLFCLVGLGINLVGVLVLDSAPTLARDALIHHLAVPKMWLQEDAILPISWHIWSFYPMLLNMAFVGFLSFNLELLANFYHASYFLIFLAAFGAFLHLRYSGDNGSDVQTSSNTTSDIIPLLGVFLCSAVPMFLRLAGEPLVDLGLLLYSFLAFALAITYLKVDRVVGVHTGLTGLALGLALSVKPTGVMVAAIFSIFFVLWSIRNGSKLITLVSQLALIGATSLIVYLPWGLKNLLWTGNPFYPLFHSFFTASANEPGAEALPDFSFQDRSQIEVRIGNYGESIVDFLLLPFRMFFQGQDDNPQYFDGVLNPVFLIALAAVLLVRSSKILAPLLIAATITVGIAMFESGFRIRYLVPVLWMLPLALSVILVRLTQASHRFKVIVFWAIIVFAQVFTMNYLFGRIAETHALEAFSMDSNAFRAKFSNEYRVASRVNKEVKPLERVFLLLTGNRFYFFDVPVISPGYDSASWSLQLLEKSSNIRQMRDEFKKFQADYVLLHLERTSKVLNNTFQDNKGKVKLWYQFVGQCFNSRFAEFGYSLIKFNHLCGVEAPVRSPNVKSGNLAKTQP